MDSGVRRSDEQEQRRPVPAGTGLTARETGRRHQTSVVSRLAALALLACLHATTAPAAEPAPTPKEAAARQQLEHVREEIHRITDEQRGTSAERDSVTDDLRARELAIARTAKEMRALDQKLAAQQARLTGLVGQRAALEASLQTQRDALAALLRSAYALGRNEELRLLLMQDDIDAVGRVLGYYRYFERARVGEIDRLLAGLDALARVRKAIEDETGQIARSRAQRADDAARLASERDERRAALARLESTLNDQRSRLAALGRDERSLLELIARLRDVFADIPKQITGAEPFARQRGRLAWPLPGSARGGAADEGNGHGVLIAAAEGGEVRAVSHGRVVFADWLRGYGLLLIIDHGDGYLSLYGCNETLLKDVGDWVDAGDVIATSGASGGRRTPGLYFELRHDGKPLDAHAWLRPASHLH